MAQGFPLAPALTEQCRRRITFLFSTNYERKYAAHDGLLPVCDSYD